jgi:hypothetical protein
MVLIALAFAFFLISQTWSGEIVLFLLLALPFALLVELYTMRYEEGKPVENVVIEIQEASTCARFVESL